MSRPERAVVADNEVKSWSPRPEPRRRSTKASRRSRSTPSSGTSPSTSTTTPRRLARMAVDETGIGNYEDKVLKNKGKARVIWNNLKGKKSRGIIGEDAENNLVFVAKPMGVVAAVCPVTNPIVTPMCNGMFALKAGNAVIFAPHPKAQKCTRASDEGVHEDRQEARRPRKPCPDDQEGLRREDPGADEAPSTSSSRPGAAPWSSRPIPPASRRTASAPATCR